MNNHKFDVKKLSKLNNPERLSLIDLDKIIEELQLPKDSTIVDIGIGTGIFSEAFLSKLPNSKGLGFDISEDMIKWVKENRKDASTGRLSIAIMSENEIPLAENTADLVFMITVHHELKDPVSLLKDAKRVLKNDGKLLICDWKEGVHKHFVTKESILEDLDSSGFKNIKELNNSNKLISLIATK
ncbi:class I SAM-dependent methyltransferase [Clostridium tertium]|jgi:ubiquinone/menaquinone biosynthesis C-methylase UbiE|uniref:class I SAM-dependent methyltransferase n=1 Tax=Clostridium tertium TaxID=1559 RepID=UPI001AE60B9E|nr:class I SAM-dependent methyltransferase [Clostridium tertium]MBP1870077.1 ubiquinone/menaquinone biosynthesis C-methylase UbiE [Clostridium tertium]